VTLISRLLRRIADPREGLRPLWHRVVEIAREPGWYAGGGIADTVPGRFDAITLVLAIVLLRMERAPQLAASASWLTELFVEDMDGQLRESGVGDLVVGKHVGRLMSVLGGRLGALRAALAAPGEAELVAAVERNASLAEGGDPAAIAAGLRELARQLDSLPDAALLAGEIAR
jgi:cytochrome b pre-mRNA-processing protein 3